MASITKMIYATSVLVLVCGILLLLAAVVVSAVFYTAEVFSYTDRFSLQYVYLACVLGIIVIIAGVTGMFAASPIIGVIQAAAIILLLLSAIALMILLGFIICYTIICSDVLWEFKEKYLLTADECYNTRKIAARFNTPRIGVRFEYEDVSDKTTPTTINDKKATDNTQNEIVKSRRFRKHATSHVYKKNITFVADSAGSTFKFTISSNDKDKFNGDHSLEINTFVAHTPVNYDHIVENATHLEKNSPGIKSLNDIESIHREVKSALDVEESTSNAERSARVFENVSDAVEITSPSIKNLTVSLDEAKHHEQYKRTISEKGIITISKSELLYVSEKEKFSASGRHKVFDFKRTTRLLVNNSTGSLQDSSDVTETASVVANSTMVVEAPREIVGVVVSSIMDPNQTVLQKTPHGHFSNTPIGKLFKVNTSEATSLVGATFPVNTASLNTFIINFTSEQGNRVSNQQKYNADNLLLKHLKSFVSNRQTPDILNFSPGSLPEASNIPVTVFSGSISEKRSSFEQQDSDETTNELLSSETRNVGNVSKIRYNRNINDLRQRIKEDPSEQYLGFRNTRSETEKCETRRDVYQKKHQCCGWIRREDDCHYKEGPKSCCDDKFVVNGTCPCYQAFKTGCRRIFRNAIMYYAYLLGGFSTLALIVTIAALFLIIMMVILPGFA